MSDTLLYFGSFNPIHRGHLDIARYAVAKGLGEVWLVVSPHNPLKEVDGLAPDADRLRMAEIAVTNAHNHKIKVCDAEFSLPRPSYTIDTLRALQSQHPDRRFAVLTGSDVFEQFDRWKEYEALLDGYTFYVYPREGSPVGEYAARVRMLDDAPALELSSTQVRERLSRGEDCSAMLDVGVLDYIRTRGLWSAAANEGADHLERGKQLLRQTRHGEALNELSEALRLDPALEEARGLIEMTQQILEFKNFDLYNP